MKANGRELYPTIIWSNECESNAFAQLKSVCRAGMTSRISIPTRTPCDVSLRGWIESQKEPRVYSSPAILRHIRCALNGYLMRFDWSYDLSSLRDNDNEMTPSNPPPPLNQAKIRIVDSKLRGNKNINDTFMVLLQHRIIASSLNNKA